MIEPYLDQIRHRLSGFGPIAARPLREIHEHLLDTVQTLCDAGLSREEAEREAIERFGDAQSVATEFAVVLRKEIDLMERILKILSISNLFVAVWGLAAVAMLNPRAELLAVTGVWGITSICAALACMRKNIDPGTLIVSGITVIAVAMAGLPWTLIGKHPGFEAQIGLVLLMVAFFAQGVLGAWAGIRRQKHAADEPLAT